MDNKIKISLRAARINAGLTQREAADALGIGVCTYHKWENEPENISALKQKSISKLFKIPIDSIIFLPKR